MVRVITVQDLRKLLKKLTLKTFMLKLIDQLRSDYARWGEFEKSPRHAIYLPDGVIELMPIADKEYYSFKYVNGHPNNPESQKLTVVAIGGLSSTKNGYPLLISEMTILTAIRTAVTSALASQYLAKKGAKKFGIIGTGAQSEFQTLAHFFALGTDEIFYFDIDAHAMEKFEQNLKPYGLQLHRCKDAQEVAKKSDLITTATAKKGHQKILHVDWVHNGCHINGIGGDAPGKTELEEALLKKCKIVIEQEMKSRVEGEIQQLHGNRIYAELWELAALKKKGRESDEEITLFDSVGFALEDYSALRLLYNLSIEHGIGEQLEMIPHPTDPKNLYGEIR